MSQAIKEIVRRNQQTHGNPLWPACVECGTSVRGYSIEEIGRKLGGAPFFDVRAWCHGHDSSNGSQVHRVYHPDSWLVENRSGELMAEQFRVKAITALMRFYDEYPRKTYHVAPSGHISISKEFMR